MVDPRFVRVTDRIALPHPGNLAVQRISEYFGLIAL